MKRVIKPEVKLGAEPKKIAALGGLVVVLLVVWLMNRGDSGGPPATSTPAPAAAIAPAPGVRTPVRPAARNITRSASGVRGGSLSTQEFHPVLKPREPIDTSRVDPTLLTALLTKLRSVKLEGGSRSLFEAGTAAPAPAKEIAKVGPILPKGYGQFIGPVKPAPPPPKEVVKAAPPPTIPLKFYGYTNAQRQGPKRAFFLEGEDIFVAGEGDMIKNRYKIVRIGINSAVVEDTQFKNQQTLPLIEEMTNS